VAGATFYDLLGVEPDASQREVKAAFRRRSLSVHPDHGGSAEAFVRLQEAYEVLSDPIRRAAYDRALARGERADASGTDWTAEAPDPWPPSAWAPAPRRRRSAKAFTAVAFGLALVLLAGSFPATVAPWLALGGLCLLVAGVLWALVRRFGR
jgi:curved DNA-binding protein CbpA